ncbi:hypothetical protein [Klebsiella pneumoniae]|uniref:hypothetical protein n=1 Tax=Klebsiella pneumoniae TaxID=573 RepID=UPI00388F40B9
MPEAIVYLARRAILSAAVEIGESLFLQSPAGQAVDRAKNGVWWKTFFIDSARDSFFLLSIIAGEDVKASL